MLFISTIPKIHHTKLHLMVNLMVYVCRSRCNCFSPRTCIHVLHVSLSTFVPCWPDLYWTCATGVSLSVANNHTLAIFVYLLASLFYLGDDVCRSRCNCFSPRTWSNFVMFDFSINQYAMDRGHSLLPMSAFSPYVSLDLSPLFVRPLLATC